MWLFVFSSTVMVMVGMGGSVSMGFVGRIGRGLGSGISMSFVSA